MFEIDDDDFSTVDQMEPNGHLAPDSPLLHEHVASLNVRSLMKNRVELEQFLSSTQNITILALQEVWKVPSPLPKIRGYHLLVRQRERKAGGGVGFLIKEGVNFTVNDSIFLEGEFETMAISAKFNGHTHNLTSVYRPPSGKVGNINLHLDQIMNNQGGGVTTILGDFNLDIRKSTTLINDLLSHMGSLGMKQLINMPTRASRCSETILDLIFTTDKRARGSIIMTDFSDHFTVSWSRGVKPKRSKAKQVIQVLQQDVASLANLRTWLTAADWSKVYESDNAGCFDLFDNIRQEASSICCPITEKTIKKKSFPWFTKGLAISRKTKLKLLVKARLAKCPEAKLRHWSSYTIFRNMYSKLCRRAKELFYTGELSRASGDSRKTWMVINEILGHEQKGGKSPTAIGGEVTNEGKARVLNEFYCNIARRLECKLPASRKSYKSYLPIIPRTSMELSPTDSSEVLNIITNMKGQTSYGTDGWSNKMLKSVKEAISGPLAHCINISMKLGIVPHSWKTARVTTIFKGGNREDPASYRGISLLPGVSRVLEKVIIRRMEHHMATNAFWYGNQYGFRRGHSTEMLLLKYLSSVHSGFNQGQHTVTAFLDVRQAFVCIDHNILLQKLEHYGFPTTWFESYLTGRKQHVVMNGVKSTDEAVDYGIGAGSCIGPVLFILYINDLMMNTKAQGLLFADDASIIVKDKDLEAAMNKLNQELVGVEDWFHANRLTLHPGKTKVMIHPCKKGNNIPRTKPVLCGTTVDTVATFKLVGCYLDQSLSFAPHIKYIKAKVDSVVSLLGRCNRELTLSAKNMIVQSLVQPHIDYAIAAWGGTSSRILKPLATSLKRAIRRATGSRYNCHSAPLWAKANCVNIPTAHKIACLKVGLSVAKRLAPQTLLEAYPAETPARRSIRIARDDVQLNLQVPRSTKSTHDRLPSVQIPKLYNSHATQLQDCSPEDIRKRIKASFYEDSKQYECKKPNCFSCSQSNIYYPNTSCPLVSSALL